MGITWNKTKKIFRKWGDCIIFLFNPSVLLSVLFLLGVYFISFKLKENVILILLKDILSPFILIILGLWIARDWEGHVQKISWRNQGELAIENLDNISSSIKQRIIYWSENKFREVNQFLKELLGQINVTKEACKRFNDEYVNKEDTQKSKLEETLKESEKRINIAEK